MGEYYMTTGSGSGGGGSSDASVAKAKMFFEQWEEDKGQPVGGC